jgi:hypothetical protein
MLFNNIFQVSNHGASDKLDSFDTAGQDLKRSDQSGVLTSPQSG